MILHPIYLTSALRPALLPDEILLFVQDAVGLYQGGIKVAEYQHGHVYLTSHRACYVDDEEPRSKAVAVQLKDVERCELYAGFLKSSPKVTLHPKAAKQFGQVYRTPTPTSALSTPALQASSSARPQSLTPKPAASNATWICPICSFSNAVPTNFDPATANDRTTLPACMTCGLAPPLLVVVKAALAGMSNRQETPGPTGSHGFGPKGADAAPAGPLCPRCTFDNHPSMRTCEMCGAPLQASTPQPPTTLTPQPDQRTASPGPTIPASTQPANDPNDSTKFSFRSGGEKIFLERIKGALIQRKWLLQRAPAEATVPTASAATPPPRKNIGISGLERRDSELRKNNELVIGNAFEDLNALMASAKEIIALAENFSKTSSSGTNTPQGSQGTGTEAEAQAHAHTLLSSLNLTTTKDMLSPSSSSSSSSSTNQTYLTQLSRSLADFLLDDSSGNALLKSSGGIISLVDLWAVYNRARGGVELVSPMDFSEAVELFERLKLPVQAKVFRGSGVRVVRGSEWSDERVIRALLSWLQELRVKAKARAEAEMVVGERVSEYISGQGIVWGRGVTALEAAERFGWSVGVAGEELAMAEEKGALCREVGIEGVRFWENWFGKDVGGLVGLDGL